MYLLIFPSKTSSGIKPIGESIAVLNEGKKYATETNFRVGYKATHTNGNQPLHVRKTRTIQLNGRFAGPTAGLENF